MRDELAEVWRFRVLLWQLVRRDLKVRYKNSRFGFLWSIAPPLMQVGVIVFAFKYATRMAAEFGNYSAFVLAAMIPWTYFQTAILDASQSILNMYGVVRKVYLPREIIPLATAISNFIHFLLSWVIFFIYLWVFVRAPVLPTTLLFPYLVIVQFMLVTGLGLLVACLNVFYEDVKYVVSIVMNLLLFVLPIMYLVEQVQLNNLRGVWWRPIALAVYRYNPMTALITGYRKILLEGPNPKALNGVQPLPLNYASLISAGALSFLLLLCSYLYFNRRKWQFVERP